jgi:hypothetical protein
MIKQELDILKNQGYMNNMTDKKQVIEAALLDCENSLQESYDVIDNNLHHHQKAKVLENINISLTILKLMKESY